MARRKGRILAFQALFSWDMGNKDVASLMDFPWVHAFSQEGEDAGEVSAQPKESETFARLLVAGTIEHIEEIDALIRRHLDSWEFQRINKVDLAILRISVYPLLYQKDLHPSIVINEAVDISKEYGSDDSFKFVNAVLDNIKKELGGK
ncbi:MAG: transcription antitermination factor NusB [Spirochaetia bacterium]|nr:transcription antitermination factor NusB [Spirochaetia bacterium]MDY3755583.1 transcription antitermination factor NusB [Treponema sp.]